MAASLCPQCGSPRVPGSRFCGSCAFDFWKAAEGAAAPGLTNAIQPPTPPPVDAPSAPSWPPQETKAPGAGRNWGRIALIVVGAVIALAVIGTAARTPGTDAQSPAAAESATERPTSTEPEATRTPVHIPSADPEFAYQLWTSTFDAQWDELFANTVPDAMESDFYWIQSVDRAAYDPSANQIVYDATIDFESVYLNDPQEWRADTWDLYQVWSRNVWASFVDGWEGGVDSSYTPDWDRWTPSLLLNGNAGRLVAQCPGGLIYRVSQRQASQAEFLAECSFVP